MNWEAAVHSRATSRLSIHDSELPSRIWSSDDDEDDASLNGYNDDDHASAGAAHRFLQNISTDDTMIRGIHAAMLGATLLFQGEKKNKIMNTWSEVAAKASAMDRHRSTKQDDPLDAQLAINLEQQARAIDQQVPCMFSYPCLEDCLFVAFVFLCVA
jgi:hypothetical protein